MDTPSPATTAEIATLTYSHHAIERALSRKLPMLPSLPPVARLADRDSGGAIYKITDTKESFYVILADDSVVVTTFRKEDREWQSWMQARQKRRRREMCGLATNAPDAEAEYAACQQIKGAFTDLWQSGSLARYSHRRARRFLCSPHPRQVRAEQMRLLRQGEETGIAAGHPVH